MTDRWWAPGSPRIGLDDVDVAMLSTDGSSARLDLGAALVVAHRVGAAALDDAARTPLVDAGIVVQRLADARARLGLPLAEAVSKSVEGERYAMVLVRDVLDEADATAFDLYRAAVAKGVAPSIAAARAGAVYGATGRDLGRYRTLATDPRANQAALIDTADRVLFTSIEKIVSAETDDREEVSKAPAAVAERTAQQVRPDDPATPYYDARDASGQFAVGAPSMLARMRSRFGIGGQEPPSVATERPSETLARTTAPPDQTEQQPRPKSPSLRQRREAQQRRRGQTRRKRLVPAEQAQRQQAQRGQRQRKRGVLSQRERKQLTVIAPKSTMAKPQQEDRVANRNHPFLDMMRGRPENYRTLPQEMVIPATMDQAQEFTAVVASSPGRLARLGHLLQFTGTSRLAEADSDAHIQNMQEIADQADGMEPTQRYVPAEDLADMALDERKQYLHDIRTSMATVNGRLNTGKLEHISVVPELGGEGMYVVDESSNLSAGSPEAYEFVLTDATGRVEAVDEFDERGMAWKLDPDQAYRVQDATSWETYFHDGVLVHRIRLTPVEERTVQEYQTGVRKAAGAAVVMDRPDTPYYDTRDAGGKFTAGGPSIAQRLAARQIVPQAASQEMTMPLPKRPSLRERRAAQSRRRGQTRRRERQQTPAQQQAERRPMQRAQATRQQRRLRQQVGRAVDEVVAFRERRMGRSLEFSDNSDYVALSYSAALQHGMDPLSERAHWVDGALSDLLWSSRTTGDQMPEAVSREYREDRHNGEVDPRTATILDYPHSDDDYSGVQAILDDFLSHDDVAMVTTQQFLDDPTLMEINTNKHPPMPVVVVQFSSDLDYGSGNFELQFQGDRVVSHDELLGSGAVHGYVVPVAHYLAVPSRNPEGRR